MIHIAYRNFGKGGKYGHPQEMSDDYMDRVFHAFVDTSDVVRIRNVILGRGHEIICIEDEDDMHPEWEDALNGDTGDPYQWYWKVNPHKTERDLDNDLPF
jgi:hypothetical protein